MGQEGDTPKVREGGSWGPLGWREVLEGRPQIREPHSTADQFSITMKGQGPGTIENLYPALVGARGKKCPGHVGVPVLGLWSGVQPRKP